MGKGRLFHSGLPHKGINSQEFVNEAVVYLQKRFYAEFPPVRMEGNYIGLSWWLECVIANRVLRVL